MFRKPQVYNEISIKKTNFEKISEDDIERIAEHTIEKIKPEQYTVHTEKVYDAEAARLY